jgi:Ca2+-binding RTX toxin-like protein
MQRQEQPMRYVTISSLVDVIGNGDSAAYFSSEGGGDLFALQTFAIRGVPTGPAPTVAVYDGSGSPDDVIDFSTFTFDATAPGGLNIALDGADLAVEFGAAFGPLLRLQAVEALNGSSRGDYIETGATSLRLVDAGAGDDVIVGSARVAVHGGAGFDTLDLSGGLRGVLIDFQLGHMDLGAGLNAVSGIEHVVGTSFADTVIGGAANEVFADLGGSDVFDGGLGRDMISYDGFNLPVVRGIVANLDSGWIIDQSNGVDRVTSVEDITGSAGGDFIFGTRVGNFIASLGGNDSIVGVGGGDTIDGGDGDDLIIGSTFEADGTPEFMYLLGGRGRDFIMTGGHGSASMAGGEGDDILWGGDGADVIVMGTGNDFAGGLGGVDTFSFTEALNAGDIAYIADFADNAWSAEGDWLLLPTWTQGSVTVTDVAGGAYVNIAIPGSDGYYGIMLANMTAAGLADQIVYA